MNKKNEIKIFVGGLSPVTTTETLRAYFESFTVVIYAKVEIGKKLRLSKGFGYVTVPDMRSVNRLVSQITVSIEKRSISRSQK